MKILNETRLRNLEQYAGCDGIIFIAMMGLFMNLIALARNGQDMKILIFVFAFYLIVIAIGVTKYMLSLKVIVERKRRD